MKKAILFLIAAIFVLPIVLSDPFNQTIDVNSDWNDISFLILPSDKSLFNVLSSVNGNFSQIKTMEEDGMRIWDEILPDFANDLTEIKFGYTYMIDMKNDAVITVFGYPDPSVPYLLNTSWTDWYDKSICYLNDTQDVERNLTQYDYNNIDDNTTFYEQNATGCDYCSYNVVNSSAGWQNEGGCLSNDSQLQNRTLVEYDQNYADCYAQTGLESDLWNSGINNTYLEYQYVFCDYCTPLLANQTFGWVNITCLPSGKMNQSQITTQYDTHYCGEVSNISFVDYRAVEDCEYYQAMPVIDSVSIDGQSSFIQVSPAINNVKSVSVSVLVSHTDGAGSIKNVSMITPKGLVVLDKIGDIDYDTSNYSGSFNMNYYDNPGGYILNITAYDVNGFYNESSKDFEYMALAAIVFENDNIVFQPVYPNMSTTNSTSVKNAGNVDVNLSVCGDDFVLDSSHTISVGNLIYRFEGYEFLELSKIPYVYGLNLGLNDWINLYLNLTVPLGTMPGTYNSNINITAVSG